MFVLNRCSPQDLLGKSAPRHTYRILKANTACQWRHARCDTTVQRLLRLPLQRSAIRSSLGVQQESSPSGSDVEDEPPLGCSRYSVTLSKPLGLVLEETGKGGIIVAEVAEGGNAARLGQIAKGDELIATSGITYTTEKQYQETFVKGGEQVIRLTCRGEDFKTVMAAISSHPAHIKVRLEFQRCDPSA